MGVNDISLSESKNPMQHTTRRCPLCGHDYTAYPCVDADKESPTFGGEMVRGKCVPCGEQHGGVALLITEGPGRWIKHVGKDLEVWDFITDTEAAEVEAIAEREGWWK